RAFHVTGVQTCALPIFALPIVTAPAYLFLVLLHPPAFVAEAALASIATIGAVLLFLVTVIALVRRWPMPAALACALAVWCLTGQIGRASCRGRVEVSGG